MKRALVLFIEDKPHLIKQFYCLYTSYKQIECQDTDLVLFGNKDILATLPTDIIKIPYNPISYEPEWQNYHYINSISCLTIPEAAFLSQYDLLLRTDLDTFLTPKWNNYFPSFYSVGRGGYVNDQYTKENILNIAHKFGLKHKHLFNLGSTHYGNASLIIDVAKLSLELSQYIFQEAFKHTEGAWPSWFKGVTTMYACEIAVNHCVHEIKIDEQQLDYPSTSLESIMNHAHIHCWHTDNLFSKFVFEGNGYSNHDLIGKNPNLIAHYCLHTALKSTRYL